MGEIKEKSYYTDLLESILDLFGDETRLSDIDLSDQIIFRKLQKFFEITSTGQTMRRNVE